MSEASSGKGIEKWKSRDFGLRERGSASGGSHSQVNMLIATFKERN